MTEAARASALLRRIEAREAVGPAALLLVAHPDDEVLGCSVAMRCLTDLRLVHATDGSNGDDAITAVRLRELMAALKALGVTPTLAPCAFPDGSLVRHARQLADALGAWLPETSIILTHAFEGGHPDHDACALAGQLACDAEFGRSGRRIVRLEFAMYARGPAGIRTNAFSPGTLPAPTSLCLTAQEVARKRLSLVAYRSQRHVVDRFPVGREELRAAPDHDFTLPRDPVDLLFCGRESGVEPAWRAAAQSAMAR